MNTEGSLSYSSQRYADRPPKQSWMVTAGEGQDTSSLRAKLKQLENEKVRQEVELAELRATATRLREETAAQVRARHAAEHRLEAQRRAAEAHEACSARRRVAARSPSKPLPGRGRAAASQDEPESAACATCEALKQRLFELEQELPSLREAAQVAEESAAFQERAAATMRRALDLAAGRLSRAAGAEIGREILLAAARGEQADQADALRAELALARQEQQAAERLVAEARAAARHARAGLAQELAAARAQLEAQARELEAARKAKKLAERRHRDSEHAFELERASLRRQAREAGARAEGRRALLFAPRRRRRCASRPCTSSAPCSRIIVRRRWTSSADRRRRPGRCRARRRPSKKLRSSQSLPARSSRFPFSSPTWHSWRPPSTWRPFCHHRKRAHPPRKATCRRPRPVHRRPLPRLQTRQTSGARRRGPWLAGSARWRPWSRSWPATTLAARAQKGGLPRTC
ncbi:hypothetical protein QBZ16_000086 [Prototheca wickerhamii]|uniref:Uncharacterized protein n=1 Tax=Prototheca wickerhamii TaxID=3111 RepID=A0AAD9IM87_PROWI|nr:hypothetical protein QBZ16_000086 [Prototheca wickerhamii]